MKTIKIATLALFLALTVNLCFAASSSFKVYGDFDGDMLDKFNTWYNSLPADVNEIHLRINSPGGSILVLSEMLARVTDFKGKVITYNDAMAASAGFVLFLHGDERVGYNSSMYMHHEPAGGSNGKRHELESTVELFKLFERMVVKRLERIGVSTDVIKEKFSLLRDKWFSSEELLNLKVVTKIIEK